MDNNSMNFHNIIDGIEEDYKAKKMKESILLLKRKMCKTHDLIKQYSENMKEIDHLKSHLEIAKKEAKHTISNYKSAMDKIRELELKIVDDKQNNEKLINKINEYEINIAADKQSIQQLTCKIKVLEEEHSAKGVEYDLEKSVFEDKIKDLEHELKKLKTVHKKREKTIISTNFDRKPSIDTKSSSDIGINVSLCDIESSVKREVQNKSIMTDEFYNMKDDPHPLFCAKCEAHLPPDLTPEKIYKTMTTYPKLIEKDLSPLSKKIYSPSCSLPSTYPGSIIRNEDAVFKMLSTSHLSLHSPYNDSIVGNLKSQSGQSSRMTPIRENIELRNVDISHIPVVTNLSTNLNSIPTEFTLSQNRSCAREDFCSDNLLTKHSSAIKEIERRLRLLESKMKKFRRLKKKINTNSHCCCMNRNNDIFLNSDLISMIFKGAEKYFHEKKETCSKNERDIDSELCTCYTKNSQLQNRQHSNKYNAHKNTFSWKIENLDEKDQVRDTCCSKTENGTKAFDTLQFEHTLSSVHKNNSYLDINTSNTSLNDIDETDKGEFLQHQNTLHSPEVASVKNSLATSCLIADEIYVNDNFLSQDNVKVIDQTEVERIFLSNDENSTDHTDDKTVDINAEKNKIKRKDQNKHKNKVSEIYVSNNLLSKDTEVTVETIVDTDNQKEAKNIFLSNNENSTDNDKIDINTDKIEIRRKSQNIHKDKISKIYASNNLLSKNNVETVDMDNNQLETKTISLSNENFTDDKVVDINIKDKIKVKSKGQYIYKNKIGKINTSDNLLNKDNIEATDNQTETETTSLSNNENSTDHTDSKIVDINVEKTKIKRKSQNIQKNKIGDRLLKKIRRLKRKTQANSRINKQETIEPCSNHSSEYNELTKKSRIENGEKISNYPLNHIRNLKRNLDTQAESTNKQEDNKLCSDHYEPPKKLRIAHTPKTSILELNINKNDTHCTIKNIATLMTQQKNNGNQRLDIKKINLLTESEKTHIRNKKRDEEDIVKSIETNDRKPVNEKDLDLTSAENCLQNNISPSSIERVSEFGKCDDVLIEDTINRDTDRVIGETLHDDESNVLHDNIAIDTTNDLEFENSILLRKYIITCSKDSKYKKLSEALDKIENKKEIMPTTELEYASKTLGNKSHNDHKILKDTISNESSILHDRSNVLEATQNESCNSNISTEVPRSPLPRDSGIVEDYTNDNNIKVSLDEIKDIKNRGEETYVNNETIGIRTIKTRRRNVRASQRDKEMKFIDMSHHVEEYQSHNNNDISDEANEVIRSPSPKNSDIIFESCINDNNVKDSVNEIKNARNKQEETCVNNETIEAIQTRNKNICASLRDKETKFTDVSYHDVEKSQTPMSQLIKYINGTHKKKYKLSRKKIKYACKITDEFIKKQLQRLKNNAWEDSIHDDIIEKLENTCRPRIIAKGIVEFLLEQYDGEALDKSFSPPAPLMTKFEQKIIALLFDLEVSKPTVICFVQAAIEYHLFRLDSNVKVQVNSLTRIYVALSRIQKDREKIRMMCCDALYCTNLKSIGILLTILTSWYEVLPHAENNKGILPRCIAFLIGSHQIKNACNMERLLTKLRTLKKFISNNYNYVYTKETINDFAKELMTALKTERIDGLDTAIILVAKREGPSWTYKNIIQSALLPMIIKNEHPCIYSAFSLLGRLLRAFPLKDNDNIVQEISEQLCDLIQSGQGSHDQQEGIISALLSLSRHKFNIIASPVIEWMPSKSLRPIVDAHLQAFLNTHSSMFWQNYLQNKNIKLN